MHEESCCFQAKALRFAPAGTCQALACPSRKNRTLQAAKSYKLSRKSPESAQTVLGFAGSWGWGGTQSNQKSNHQADRRTKLSPPRPSPLPQPRPPESGTRGRGGSRAGRPGSAWTAGPQGPHSPERQEPLAHQPQRDPQQAQSHQPPHGAERSCRSGLAG